MSTAKKIATAVVVLSFGFSFFSPVFAEESDSGTNSPTSTTSTIKPIEKVDPRVEAKQRVEELKVKAEQIRETAKSKAEGIREAAKNKAENLREMAKDKREDRVASREAKFEELRGKFDERMNELRGKIASKEAALKKKLENFKDKEKAIITERVSNNLNEKNKNRVDEMNKNLGKMASIIEKLQKISSDAAAKGKDSTSTESAIEAAQTAISNAQGLVNAQAGNDYTVVVSDEGKIKDDVKNRRDQLATDLKVAHESVVVARKSVSDAISTVKSLFGGSSNGQ